MYGKRGGRVQVNMMQFYELVERVTALENALSKTKVKEVVKDTSEDEMTKKEVIDLLVSNGIKHNPRDKKEVLLDLLNNEVESCQEDRTESD